MEHYGFADTPFLHFAVVGRILGFDVSRFLQSRASNTRDSNRCGSIGDFFEIDEHRFDDFPSKNRIKETDKKSIGQRGEARTKLSAAFRAVPLNERQASTRNRARSHRSRKTKSPPRFQCTAPTFSRARNYVKQYEGEREGEKESNVQRHRYIEKFQRPFPLPPLPLFPSSSPRRRFTSKHSVAPFRPSSRTLLPHPQDRD